MRNTKKWFIWAHSDQTGGMELACIIAKAKIETLGNPDEVVVLAPDEGFVKQFLKEQVLQGDKVTVIKTERLLRIEKSADGRVDAGETHKILTGDPFRLGPAGRFDSIEGLIDGYANQLRGLKANNDAFMISCGEPVAMEVAYKLGIPSVIVTDHLLTCSVRWVLRNGGVFDKRMAELFTLFEEFDRRAKTAFLAPLEFASDDYVVYLEHGSIDCVPMGGLFYEPISRQKISANPEYQNLVNEANNFKVVFVFGGGGPLWFKLYSELQRLGDQGAAVKPNDNFALLIPAMESSGAKRLRTSGGKFAYYLYTPDGKRHDLEDPGVLMYWYAHCHLFVGRGGLAAQQIFATMLSDMERAPEMLFIEEPGHPQIEHERKSLYSLGFVHTRTWDAFRAAPMDTIREVLTSMNTASVVQKRDRIRVRYGTGMLAALAKSLNEL